MAAGRPRYQARSPHWRPVRDLARHYDFDHTPVTAETPATPQAALEYVSDLCLDEVVAYDGYPKIQAEVVADRARALFPGVFGVVAPPEPSSTPLQAENRVAAFYARHRRTDGRIDWSEVAKNTIYTVSAEPLPAAAAETVVEIPLQPGELTTVDLEAKVG